MERENVLKPVDVWRPIADTTITSDFASITLACKAGDAASLSVNSTRLRRLMNLSRMETPINITTASQRGRNRPTVSEGIFDPRGRKQAKKGIRETIPSTYQIVPERGKWNIMIDSDELHRRAVRKSGDDEILYRKLMNHTIRRALHKTIFLDKMGPEMYFKTNYYMRLIAIAANIYGLNYDLAKGSPIEYGIVHQLGLCLYFNLLFNGTFDYLRKKAPVPIPDDHNRREGIRRVLPTLPIEECAIAAAYLSIQGRMLIK